MADVAVRSNATAAVPNDYTIPGAQELLPKLVSAHMDGSGTTAQWFPCLQILDPAGNVMGSAIDRSNPMAAGASADVSWFPHLATPSVASGAGATLESFFMDTRSPTGTSSATVLVSGQQYLITAQGSWSYVNHALDVGTPDANALYPTPGSRISTQVGFDPETLFAYWSGNVPSEPIGHVDFFKLNLGSGFTYTTPTTGTHSTPTSNHSYQYKVTGQGSPLTAIFNDQPGQFADNYGYVLITIQQLGGSTVPGVGPDHSILRSESGVAVWESQPDITESDLSLSDVTTANVSTSAHGLAPKAPNDATKFLNGTGSYSTPAGTVPLTTKGDLFGYDTAPDRIPVGSNSQVLTADSTQALGVKWSPIPTLSGNILVFGTQSADRSTAGTTFGTGADVLSSDLTFTADGSSSYLVQVIGPALGNTALSNVTASLKLDGSDSGATMFFLTVATGSANVGIAGAAVISPSAASHTVNVRFWTSTGTAKLLAATSLGAAARIVVLVSLL